MNSSEQLGTAAMHAEGPIGEYVGSYGIHIDYVELTGTPTTEYLRRS